MSILITILAMLITFIAVVLYYRHTPAQCEHQIKESEFAKKIKIAEIQARNERGRLLRNMRNARG